ncbi:MAG: type II secretion system major pseudopilin GspG [Sulfuricaulis sp.]|nr:type II secretion system major pseudopilin GspG [Sulfuricaulis sp.]
MKHVTRFSMRSGGFTLIEVLVVVVILSILAAVIVPKIMDRPDQARKVAATTEIKAIVSALKLYRLDHGKYPALQEGLAVLVAGAPSGKGPRGGYLDRMPKDPWGTDYIYSIDETGEDIEVISLGADGAPGGEGINKDISSRDP